MISDFIGNPRSLLLAAMVIVETAYPQKRPDFETMLTE